jgi:uncharacterized protein (DUF302 family)
VSSHNENSKNKNNSTGLDQDNMNYDHHDKENEMKNYVNKTLKAGYEPTFQEVKKVLENEGFKIISEVRIHDRLKDEFQIDFKKFTILGTQNASFFKNIAGIDGENNSYTQCNFIIYELSAGETEIGCYNPIALNGFSENISWKKTEKEIIEKLDKVMTQIENSKSLIL